MSPKDGPRLVCDLCRTRAERSGWVDPAAPGANVGRRPDPEASESPRGRLDRAVERFNASEAARTVGGLTRTLGEPRLSIGAAAGSPSEVRVTVAWDLCWYQWGVDLSESCVGEYCSPQPIAIYLNGQRYTGDPRTIELTDQRQIAIVIGTPPAQIPSTADFSQD